MMKVCVTHEVEHPVSDFEEGRNDCREARKEKRRARRQQPDVRAAIAAYQRSFRLKSLYDISVKDYDTMVISQNGLCAICNRPETIQWPNGDLMPLAVDHDHATGEVRGLLCANCNRGIGLFEDSVETLQRAIRYLRD